MKRIFLAPMKWNMPFVEQIIDGSDYERTVVCFLARNCKVSAESSQMSEPIQAEWPFDRF